MSKLYGVVEFVWKGRSHKQMMDEVYLSIFRYKCSIEEEENDGWRFCSLCEPTGKFDATQEAQRQRDYRKYESKFSRGHAFYTYKYMVKEMENTKFGWRMVIPKKMLEEAVANVTRRYPYLVEKVKPEFAQFIDKNALGGKFQFA